MASRPIRIALDLSCAFEAPLTGVGYAAMHQVRALIARREPFDLRLVAARSRAAAHAFDDVRDAFSRRTVYPCARLLKYYLWTRLEWPPIEWFSGDVEIAHGFFHQVPATRRAIRLVTIHDLSFFRVPETHTRRTIGLQRVLLRQCVRRADACVAVSQHCKDELVNLLGLAPEKITVVPNGVNLSEFQTELDQDALSALKGRVGLRRPYFIHLGTVEPRKNIPRLLDAYQRLRERRRDCPQLVLVGKAGWLSAPILEKLHALNLGADLIHCGYLTRNQAVLLLRGATACVYPSLYEGFGLPALEAMAARVPVIASDTSSLPEVVGDTGLLVNPTDTEAIEAALEDVMQPGDATRARVEAAYRRAQTFTWDRSAQALADVYRKLAS